MEISNYTGQTSGNRRRRRRSRRQSGQDKTSIHVHFDAVMDEAKAHDKSVENESRESDVVINVNQSVSPHNDGNNNVEVQDQIEVGGVVYETKGPDRITAKKASFVHHMPQYHVTKTGSRIKINGGINHY